MKNNIKRMLAAFSTVLLLVTAIPFSSSAGTVADRIRESGDILSELDAGKLKKEMQANAKKLKSAGLLGASSLPEAYSSVTAGYVTEPKNQGLDGACWLFAGTSAAEASYAVNTGKKEDFSELQAAELFGGECYDILGNASGDNNICDINPIDGGNSLYTIFSGASWKGLEREELCSYSMYKAQVFRNYNNKEPSELYGNDTAHMQNAWIVPYLSADSMLDLYKTFIKSAGAVDCGYHHDDRYYNSLSASYYSTAGSDMQNHEISIVGWNDNYPKENFKSGCRPLKNGAWLVKNNWGTDWGTDGDAYPGEASGGGYFWMSYYDTSLDNVLVFDYTPADTYKYNYQYDGCAGVESMIVGAGESICSTYTVRGLTSDKERIDAVGIGIYDMLVGGTVSIYKGGESGSPMSGTLVAKTSFRSDLWGYQTIPIPDGPVIKAGEDFTVVFTFDDPAEIFIDAECDTAWGSCRPSFENERTYIVTAGGGVGKLAAQGITPRIKAYTNDAGKAAEENHTVYFDGGEGSSGLPVPQIKSKGQSMTLQYAVPRKSSNYKFLGWTKTEGGSSVDYLPGGIYSDDCTEDVTLYAVWETLAPDKCTVTPERFPLYVGKGAQTVKVTLEPEGDFTPVVCVSGVDTTVTEDGRKRWYTDGLEITEEGTGEISVRATEYVKSSPIVYLTVEAEGTSYKVTRYLYVSAFVPGDINGDGKFNGVDSSMMKEIIAGILEPVEAYLDKADINGDGKINSVDSSLLKYKIVGID